MRNGPLRDPGALTADDRKRVRAYQQSVPGMTIDGRPEHQTVNHMLDRIEQRMPVEPINWKAWLACAVVVCLAAGLVATCVAE